MKLSVMKPSENRSIPKMSHKFWNDLNQIAENNGLKLLIADNAKVKVHDRGFLQLDGVSFEGTYYKVVLDTYSNVIEEGKPLSHFIYGYVVKDDFYDIENVFLDITEEKAKFVCEELMALAKGVTALKEYLRNTNLNEEIFESLFTLKVGE